MRDVFLSDGLGPDSCLNCDREEMRRDRFFDLDADILGVLECLLFVDKESQGVDRVVHDVDDDLHDV